MSKTKKTYSRAFKLKVVQSVEAGELRPAHACREYPIAARVLPRWRYAVRLRGAEAAFTPLRGPTATPNYAACIAELEWVCDQLAVEHAALQKALQREEVYRNQYESYTDAEAQLDRFIDDVYKLKRLCSSLDYLSPVEYESLYPREAPLIGGPVGWVQSTARVVMRSVSVCTNASLWSLPVGRSMCAAPRSVRWLGETHPPASWNSAQRSVNACWHPR